MEKSKNDITRNVACLCVCVCVCLYVRTVRWDIKTHCENVSLFVCLIEYNRSIGNDMFSLSSVSIGFFPDCDDNVTTFLFPLLGRSTPKWPEYGRPPPTPPTPTHALPHFSIIFHFPKNPNRSPSTLPTFKTQQTKLKNYTVAKKFSDDFFLRFFFKFCFGFFHFFPGFETNIPFLSEFLFNLA